MTLRVTLGVDPGQTGAIAILADEVFSKFIDMPVLKRSAGGMHVDAVTLAAALRGIFSSYPGANVLAVLEEVAARPGQGVSAMFRFGESYGVVRGVLGALGIPFLQVSPAVWKRNMQLLGKDKDCARTCAINRHPSAAPELIRKKDVGRADALLIATWAHNTEQAARLK
jgi:crossover junction endodeoxyribonuclease RuvC